MLVYYILQHMLPVCPVLSVTQSSRHSFFPLFMISAPTPSPTAKTAKKPESAYTLLVSWGGSRGTVIAEGVERVWLGAISPLALLTGVKVLPIQPRLRDTAFCHVFNWNNITGWNGLGWDGMWGEKQERWKTKKEKIVISGTHHQLTNNNNSIMGCCVCVSVLRTSNSLSAGSDSGSHCLPDLYTNLSSSKESQYPTIQ